MKSLHWLSAILICAGLSACNNTNKASDQPGDQAKPAASDTKLVVYSSRKEHLIKPLFDKYTAATGVQIEYITDKAGPLIQRLKAEGESTEADLFITVDAGNLWSAAQAGVLQALDSKTLQANIPANLRDPGNQWAGLSVRARTLVYGTDRVKPAQLRNYADLASNEWHGKLCLRTSKKVYNQSLVAMMIAEAGEPQAEEIVKGWVKNLATDPFSNDTKTIEAVLAGQCDVAVVNSYYFGRLQKKDPAIKAALFWPAKADGGVHVNVSGAGVTKHSDQTEAAQALLEWLSGKDAQALFAGENLEFPANPAVNAVPQVAAWGKFDSNLINVAKAGAMQAKAVKLMDRVGYR